MSTAIAEPPVKTTQPDPIVPISGDAPTPAQKEAILNMLRKETGKKDHITEEVKTVTEVSKQEPAKEEKKTEVKEEKKAEPVKTETKAEPVKTTEQAQQSFAELRQKMEAKEKEAAEITAERDRLKTQYEELSKKPAPEEFLKELELTKKEKAEMQKRLRESDISRDPDFIAQFDTPIRTAMQHMVDIAAASGVDKKEATAAVSAWNEGTFKEWLAGMDEMDKLKFGAHLQQAVTLYSQKESALEQADQTYQNLVKQREDAQKSQREQYLSTLNSDIESNLKELAETPLGKDHTELLAETRGLLRRAGGLEGERIDNKTLLGMVGKSLLLAKGFEKQEKALAERAEKIAELEKTLAERDAFIKEQSGATPPVNGSLPAAKGDRKAAARAILNPVIN